MDYVPLTAVRSLAAKYGFEKPGVDFREDHPPYRRVAVFVRFGHPATKLSVMCFPIDDGDLVSSTLYEWYSERLVQDTGD